MIARGTRGLHGGAIFPWASEYNALSRGSIGNLHREAKRQRPRHGSLLFISFFPFCPFCYFFIYLSLIFFFF
jgi:hypothetical protein